MLNIFKFNIEKTLYLIIYRSKILMKNVIIFGGAGFIGTNLTKYLLNKDYKVLSVDNFYTGQLENVQLFSEYSNYKFLYADITKEFMYQLKRDIEDFLDNKVDEIYNLACPASLHKYQKDPLYTIDCSLAIKPLCLLALYYHATLLHASTSEVYGDPLEHPQSESYKGNVNIVGPRSCYDEGKRIAETIIYLYIQLGLKAKIIRIFNTYGPYMDPTDGRVISNFINQALQNQDITIYGDGSQTRSFQYIDDLIIAIDKVMHNTDEDFYGPINIGSEFEFTIKELADLVLKMISESTSQIIYKELPKDDPIQRQTDNTKLYKKTHHISSITLEEGLEKTIKYFKSIYE